MESQGAPADRIISNINSIFDSIRAVSSKKPLTAVFLSAQRRQFCSLEPNALVASDTNFVVLPEIQQVVQQGRRFDIAILCCHNAGEEALLFAMRAGRLARFYVCWMWDNHHHQTDNLRTALLADAICV